MLDFTFVQVTTRSQLCTRHFLTFEYNQLVLLFFCHSGPTTPSKGHHVHCGHWGVCSLLELLDQNGSNQNIEDVIIVITAVATQQNLLHQRWYWRKKKSYKKIPTVFKVSSRRSRLITYTFSTFCTDTLLKWHWRSNTRVFNPSMVPAQQVVKIGTCTTCHATIW